MDRQGQEFDRLYRECYSDVYRTTLGFLGDLALAEDIAQEAFLKAFQAFASFREEASFRTWVIQIVLNLCKDHWVRRKKLPLVELTEDQGFRLEDLRDPDDGNSPETAALEGWALFKCLHCLTECLPPAQRHVFCLTVTLDLSHRQAAQILGISEGAVKASLHRAVTRWKGYMEDRCGFIKKSNPCRCRQWVRFGQARGWVPKGRVGPDVDFVNPLFRGEVVRLRDLRQAYQKAFGDAADSRLTEVLAADVRSARWAILQDG